ncbi:HNH endonuclease, partial [Pseudarthrobacter sp902506025]
MEAIGEHLGEAYGRKAYDAGSWLPHPAHLHAVPGEASQHRATGPGHQDLLAGLAARLAAVSLAAPDVLESASYLEAAEFAARAEELARSVEYLQLLGAGAVDRTRAQAITDAAATARAARSAAVVETDANWPNPPAGPGHPVVTSPADDGCRNTAEFLRLRLHIPIREARRRLTLAHQVLPATSLTGEPLPPARPHLAAAITPTTTGATDTDSDTGITSPAGHGPAVSSHAAAIITATLDRLQH